MFQLKLIKPVFGCIPCLDFLNSGMGKKYKPLVVQKWILSTTLLMKVLITEYQHWLPFRHMSRKMICYPF